MDFAYPLDILREKVVKVWRLRLWIQDNSYKEKKYPQDLKLVDIGSINYFRWLLIANQLCRI